MFYRKREYNIAFEINHWLWVKKIIGLLHIISKNFLFIIARLQVILNIVQILMPFLSNVVIYKKIIGLLYHNFVRQTIEMMSLQITLCKSCDYIADFCK